MRIACLAVLCALLSYPASAADKQIKPFIAVSFGGQTTFVELENEQQVGGGAAPLPKDFVFGVSTAVLWDIVGFDVDFSRQSRDNEAKALTNSITTLTGNIVLTLPHHLTEYTLRPYFVGGAGLIHLGLNDFFDAFTGTANVAGIDLGGGVTGFITNRVGVNWEIRRFQSFTYNPPEGEGLATFGPGKLSFWRASMALVLRY
jgi:opacity protein-like surface antigen